MRTIITVCLTVTLSSAVALQAQEVAVSRFWTETLTPIRGRVVKGQPYSAEIVTESIQTLADGNRIVRRTTGRVYRDTEGRVRREDDRPSGGPTITITDPVANSNYTLDPANHTAQATAFTVYVTSGQELNELRWELRSLPVKVFSRPQPSVQAAPSPVTPTAQPTRVGRVANDRFEEALGNRAIEGVLASGVRRTTTIEKGAIGNELPIKIVSEEWTSPDLQVLVMTDVNDPRSGRSTYQLLNITRVDPAPALFQVPPDYTVRPGRGGTAGGEAGGRGRGGRGQ